MNPAATQVDDFDLAEVERALARLWAGDEGPAAHHDAVRACSLNLAIPVAPGTYDRWQQAVAELSRLLPSRILVLDLDREASGPAIDAQVTATCHRRKGGLVVCSEVVRLSAHADAVGRLPSICRALAVSDLPFCLLALDDDRFDAATNDELLALAEIIITDSCSSQRARVEAAALEKTTDLAWPRLAPWRAALGNFLWTCLRFDAGSLRQVGVVGDRQASRLFVGWLAQLLGWHVADTARGRVPYVRDAADPLDIRLLPASESICGLSAVTLRLANDDFVKITPGQESEFALTAEFGGERQESRMACRRLSFAEEVASIVHSHGMDRLYAQARTWSDRLLGPIEATG
jgi:glucose-6-phosphate dehydrogenase assembly protein OpcA